MSSKANLFLGLLWIMISPLCFLTDNTGMGIVWLCAGVVELIIAFIRRNKDANCKCMLDTCW